MSNMRRRQQRACTSGLEEPSSSVSRSIADRRPWWPPGHRSNSKHASSALVSNSSSSSNSETRPLRVWPASRQPGISSAPSLAPLNGSTADGQGTAPAEARPREEPTPAQPQQPESQHDMSLLSPAPVLSGQPDDRRSTNSTRAAHPISPTPKCSAAQDLDSARTPLAQHFATHGPPKLIFFDLETTGACDSRRM